MPEVRLEKKSERLNVPHSTFERKIRKKKYDTGNTKTGTTETMRNHA